MWPWLLLSMRGRDPHLTAGMTLLPVDRTRARRGHHRVPEETPTTFGGASWLGNGRRYVVGDILTFDGANAWVLETGGRILRRVLGRGTVRGHRRLLSTADRVGTTIPLPPRGRRTGWGGRMWQFRRGRHTRGHQFGHGWKPRGRPRTGGWGSCRRIQQGHTVP
jgi:hypothetical protein